MKIRLIPALLCASAFSSFAAGPGTAFTYQGRLSDGGAPAQGLFDFRFSIYGSSSGSDLSGGPITNTAVSVTSGLFNAVLDFGSAFSGNSYWLEISVRTNGSGSFATLSPRQAVTPTPYALYAPTAGSAGTASIAATANSVAAANIVGTIADDRLSPNIARLAVSNTAVQATGHPIVTSGFITGAVVDNGGVGYASPPTVSVSDATGSGAIIVSAISAGGVVTNLTVQNAGAGYSPTPSLTIAPPPSNEYQVFSSTNYFRGVNLLTNGNNIVAGTFNGNGAGLANLDAAALAAGIVPDARLAANIARTNQVWQLHGNAGTTAGSDFVGTTDGRPLELRSSTFVGVNRTAKLSSQEYFGIDAPATNNWGGMYIRTLGTNTLPFYGYVNSGSYAWTDLNGADANKWRLVVQGVVNMVVTTNGLVGIGTQNPAAPLEVAGPSGTSIRVSGPGGNGAQVAYDLATYNPGTNQPGARLLARDSNFSALVDLQTKNQGSATNPLVSRLHVNGGGEIGIGTTNPLAQLHVQRGGPSGVGFGGNAPAIWGDGVSGFGVIGSGATLSGRSVLGISSGGLATAVEGRDVSTNNSISYGVAGYSSSTNGSGVYASNSNSNGPALTIGSGGIRIAGAGAGSSTAAFVHQAATNNVIAGYITVISHPLTDNDPYALLFVTHNWNPPGLAFNYETHPYSVYYIGPNWAIYNDDGGSISNMTFNVLVIKR